MKFDEGSKNFPFLGLSVMTQQLRSTTSCYDEQVSKQYAVPSAITQTDGDGYEENSDELDILGTCAGL
jgi:hypothetical protein